MGSQIDHGKTQMFGWFELKSPLTAEQRRWIETRFTWLRKEFGEERLRGVVVTPTDEFFPDRYCATEEDTTVLLDRLCGYMARGPARASTFSFMRVHPPTMWSRLSIPS